MGERGLDLSGSGEGQWTFVNTLMPQIYYLAK